MIIQVNNIHSGTCENIFKRKQTIFRITVSINEYEYGVVSFIFSVDAEDLANKKEFVDVNIERIIDKIRKFVKSAYTTYTVKILNERSTREKLRNLLEKAVQEEQKKRNLKERS